METIANGYLPQASNQLHVFDKKDAEDLKLGAVHRSPYIHLMTEANPEKKSSSMRPLEG